MQRFPLPGPEDLRSVLLAPPGIADKNPFVSQAAVLLLVYSDGSDFYIPLTVRSNDMPLHPGQISLPGGCVQTSDSGRVATALREAKEEIGVALELSSVLGCLPSTTTGSGFEITPIVAWTSSMPTFLLDPREVAKLITLPLQLALDISQYKQDYLVENGAKREFYFLDFDGHYIWGATARILRSLASLLQCGSEAQ